MRRPRPHSASSARRGTPRAARAAGASLLAGPAILALLTLGGSAPPTAAAEPRAPEPRAEQASWGWPVHPVRVLEPFRAPPTPYAAGHRGIDLAADAGTRVVAPASGVVSFTGSVAGRPIVSIDHGGGYVSAIEPVSALVTEGEAVAPGQPIGEVAAGGHCDGGCVHFGVRLHGEYVSPMMLLGGVRRAVLLPMR
ncbi:M23 family metallopeptidase [Agromyces soli]